MKPFKAISFFIAVLLAAGCAVEPAQTAETTASPKKETNVQTTVIETTIGKEASASAETEEQTDRSGSPPSQTDPAISSEVFEKVSYETLSDAEQIYNSLYYFADFKRYTTFELRGDIDTNDCVMVERIYFPHAGLADETIGTTHFEAFYRIADGNLSNGVDFAEYLDHFASSVYISKTFGEWYKEKFTISDGKIYASEYVIDFYGNWGKTAFVTLDKIEFSDRLIPSIKLDLSYTDYGIGCADETQARFTITMSSRGDGWKIDDCSGEGGTIALVNELFYNDAPSHLQEQIERCLKESGLM